MLLALIGFMNALIITKWLTDWSGNESQAPSVVAIMINMVLNFGEVPEIDADRFLPLISHQALVCKLLLLIVILCPPWMLFGKPLLLKRDHDKKMTERQKRGGDIELIESAKERSIQEDDINDNMDYGQTELTRLQRGTMRDIHNDGESNSLLGSSKANEKEAENETNPSSATNPDE